MVAETKAITAYIEWLTRKVRSPVVHKTVRVINLYHSRN